jgi:hypothetical protein
VTAEESNWLDMVRSKLLEFGRVRVVVLSDRLSIMAADLHSLLVHELESTYLLLPVTITRVERVGATWKVTLELKEMIPA